MTQTEGKGLRGFDKVLIGCGLGCAVIVLVTVLGITFGTMWIFTPGKQASTEVIADDASLGVIRLHELAADPGVQELFIRVLERLDEASRAQRRAQLPEALRWISDLQSQQSDPRGLNMMIPREMTIAFEEAADGEEVDYVVAFNPRAMVRMFKGLFGLFGRADNEHVRSDYAGHPVYRLDPRSHLAFVDSTVLFASSASALERAIDRIEAARTDGAASHRGEDLLASIPEGDWDFEGIVGNEAGLVDAFLAAHAGEPADEDVEADADEADAGEAEAFAGDEIHLGFGFDVVSADEISGRAVLECGDRQVAERLLAVLEKRHAETIEEAAASGLELAIESRVEGERVAIELRLVGLGEAITEVLTVGEESDEPEAARQ